MSEDEGGRSIGMKYMKKVTKEDIAATRPDCAAAEGLLSKAAAAGVGKAGRGAGRVFVLALLAGMMIGFGALLMTYVKADQELSFAVASVLGGACFSIGLVFVIVAGAELFTGNSLMIIALCERKISFGALLKNWVVVWVGNLGGALLLVALVVGCGLMSTAAGDNTIGDQMVAIAQAKVGLEAYEIFFRGILCNILVCLAVWMGFAGRTVIDKIFTTILPVMAFVAMGFEHCVANMFLLPMGVIASGEGFGTAMVTWAEAFYNIGFATLGNLVGGVVFVALAYWLAYHKKQDAVQEAA